MSWSDSSNVQELREKVESVEQDAARLLSVLQQLSQSLTSRTAASAKTTASHTAATERLSKLASSSTQQLKTVWDDFLNETVQLRQHFEVISALAEKASNTRQQVLRLEADIARLPVSKKSSQQAPSYQK